VHECPGTLNREGWLVIHSEKYQVEGVTRLILEFKCSYTKAGIH